MTYEEIAGRPVSRETLRRLERFERLVRDEAKRQNLVSAATLTTFRDRHIADSLQLLRFLPSGASVCDIGSGAGLPGIVIACTGEHEVTLVEPRRLRVQFLERVALELDLPARICGAKSERVTGRFDIITARAVAPLTRLVEMTRHLAHDETIWVLPKGRSVDSELEVLLGNWHCDVGEVSSVTDPSARIVTLRNLRAKVGR